MSGKDTNSRMRSRNSKLARLWDLLGLRAITEKIWPKNASEKAHPSYRPPATIGLWFVGVYVVLFGLTDQKYHSRISAIDMRVNQLVSQVNNKRSRTIALNRVATLQNYAVPMRPELLNPFSVISSFIGWPSWPHEQSARTLKDVLVNFREELSLRRLDQVNLRHAWLQKAKFFSAQLTDADLSRAHLNLANFDNADARGIILTDARGFDHVILTCADFRAARGLTVEMLCARGNILEGIKLDSDLEKGARGTCPERFAPKGNDTRRICNRDAE